MESCNTPQKKCSHCSIVSHLRMKSDQWPKPSSLLIYLNPKLAHRRRVLKYCGSVHSTVLAKGLFGGSPAQPFVEARTVECMQPPQYFNEEHVRIRQKEDSANENLVVERTFLAELLCVSVNQDSENKIAPNIKTCKDNTPVLIGVWYAFENVGQNPNIQTREKIEEYCHLCCLLNCPNLWQQGKRTRRARALSMLVSAQALPSKKWYE